MNNVVLGTTDVDIKMRTRPNGKWEFDVGDDKDFIPITGKELVIQRIKHRLLTKKRFYPQPTEEQLKRNEILKQNIDEEGNPYFPGDLEELGHPEYGSLLQHYIGFPDKKYVRGMLFLDLTEVIGKEAIDNNVRFISEFKIEKAERDTYRIRIGIILGDGSEADINFEV